MPSDHMITAGSQQHKDLPSSLLIQNLKEQKDKVICKLRFIENSKLSVDKSAEMVTDVYESLSNRKPT